LSDFSSEVEERNMYISIIGTAGAGKTTLFRALAGSAPNNNGNGSSLAIIDVRMSGSTP